MLQQVKIFFSVGATTSVEKINTWFKNHKHVKIKSIQPVSMKSNFTWDLLVIYEEENNEESA